MIRSSRASGRPSWEGNGHHYYELRAGSRIEFVVNAGKGTATGPFLDRLPRVSRLGEFGWPLIASLGGTALVTAPRYFASTQLCSNCGVKTKLRLRDRIYRCRDGCPPIDRDLNAAINLARLGDHTNSGETGTGTGSRPAASVTAGDGRGAIQKTCPTTTAVGTAGGDEASTPHTTHPGAGTAAPQGEAA